MKNKIKILIVLIGLVLLPISQAASMGPEKAEKPGIPGGRWWDNSEIAAQLNLTQAQKAKIEETMIKHQKEIMDMRNEAAKLELDFDSVMESSEFNAGKANELLEKIEGYHSKAKLIRGKMLIEFRSILTKDQYLKLKSIRKMRKGPGGEMNRPGQGEGRSMKKGMNMRGEFGRPEGPFRMHKEKGPVSSETGPFWWQK